MLVVRVVRLLLIMDVESHRRPRRRQWAYCLLGCGARKLGRVVSTLPTGGRRPSRASSLGLGRQVITRCETALWLIASLTVFERVLVSLRLQLLTPDIT